MVEILQLIVTALCSVIASSSFWLFVDKKTNKKDLTSKMIIGLAHERIVSLGMEYINRGYITKDEYEDLRDYLYKPYEALGGNGSAKRIMLEVDKLEIKLKADLK